MKRSYGYLYEALGTRPTVTDIAKAIRADIATAKREGLLPKTWRYRVRSAKFAGGCSIDVTVVDCPDAWIAEDFTRCAQNGGCQPEGRFHRDPACPGAQHLSDDARAAKLTLERIHDAYNHTGSDVTSDYFDVRYYGQVTIEVPDAHER